MVERPQGGATAPRNAGPVLITAALAAAGVALTAVVLHAPSYAALSLGVPWWGYAIAYWVVGVAVVHITIRNQALTFSLGEVPLVVGLAAGSPTLLLAGALAGNAVALTLFRKQPPLKVAFNLALCAVEIPVATLVLKLVLQGQSATSSIGWVALLVATMAASVVGQLGVAAIIATSTNRRQLDRLIGALRFTMPAGLVTAVVALAGVHVIENDPQAAVLLVIPMTALAVAYRGYLGERHKHARIRLLYETSGALHRTHGGEAAIATLLSQAREMFNAEIAELVLMASHTRSAPCRYVLGPAEDAALVSLRGDANEPATKLAVAERAVQLDKGPSGVLAHRGYRNGIAVSVTGEGGVAGALIVANRRDLVTAFDRDDLELLDAFAGPASVSLDNGRLEAELEYRAFHDSLTGLANRACISERLEELLATSPRGSWGVLLLDVDDFKAINDTLGHPAGDQLLMGIADRLAACLRPSDVAGRLGGDEFVVILPSITGEEDAVAVAQRVLDALRASFSLEACEVAVRASIGAAVDNASVATADDLLAWADLAMYRAKAQGKNRCVVFQPYMLTGVLARHQLRIDLERAVSCAELSVHYQPIVSLHNGDIVGAEALVRWTHPELGQVPPDDFIPLAEETGLIIPLGRFVIDQACRQLAEWQDVFPALRMSINLSGRQLQDPGLVSYVGAIFADHGVNPSHISLEVTERVMVDDALAIEALRRLRALGVRIAVDDFGTGYSSLSCLTELPIDVLKIAKPFLDRLERSDVDRALAASIVGLARSVCLDTVAEGVETVAQAEMLGGVGCNLGQGFLFGRALSEADFLTRLQRSSRSTAVLTLAG